MKKVYGAAQTLRFYPTLLDDEPNDEQQEYNAESRFEQDVWSVTELSKHVKQVVEDNFLFVKVRGEISGLKLHSSGHTYFSLKDTVGDAVLNAVCWRGTRTQARLEEGAEIIAEGRISTYPGRSNYQLVVSNAEHAGEGALLKLLLERKIAFAKEGLFDNKRELPKYPRIIGVVTSPTGSVIRDIIHRISDRYPCIVIVWPVLVQGAEAAGQVAAAVVGLNSLGSEDLPDVIIVARGGGSIEDLLPFNEECVVRAVFASRIPVISAVGHETDTTLIDYAADVRAPTPTAAAELATPVRHHILAEVLEKRHRMARALLKTVDTAGLRLRLYKMPNWRSWFDHIVMRVDDLADRGQIALLHRLKNGEVKFGEVAKRLQPPQGAYRLLEAQLKFARVGLSRAMLRKIERLEEFVNNWAGRLQQNSYATILNKGFCLVTDEAGKGLLSAGDVADCAPQKIALHFRDGVLVARPDVTKT
ncbi:MAG: exodeoxyribonuclease VII large subunit [Holosporales bacterium]|jgi:exodeoxyribonuclease VII large subunit|nr:exodeoxyribonuclease VII large subunit [Holosporales bacterium]